MNEKDVQKALAFLGDDLIEKGEYETVQRRTPKTYWRRGLIAAVLAAMLAVGCAAAYLVSMDGLFLADKSYTQGVRYREDGSKIAPTEKVMRYLSVTGPEAVPLPRIRISPSRRNMPTIWASPPRRCWTSWRRFAGNMT